jgi:hypothetical protein
MTRTGGIFRTGLLPVCLAVLATAPVGAAFAQGQQQYDTPLYTTSAPTEVDKNYGLPTFGMPGADMPQQKTMAPEKKPEDSATPDFFKDAKEIALPQRPRSTSTGSSSSETPLYTTTEGSTTDDMDTTSGKRASSDLAPDSGYTTR